MIRRSVVILTAVAASGCFDFDNAYNQYCDGGRCSDGGATGGGGAVLGGGGGSTGGGAGGSMGGGGGSTGGGGGSTGGGSGGGAMGGGGGATGGGSGGGGGAMGGGGGAMGGGTGGGGPVDAGCPSFLCPVLDWTSPRSSIYYTVAPGLMTESLNRFHIFASFEANAPGSNNFTHFEYRFVDGGVNTIQRFLDNRVETRQLRGISMTDYVVTYRISAERYEGSMTPENFYGCTLTDGGVTDPWHWAVFPVTADEMWFAGYPNSICHWTRTGGLVATVDPDARPSMYLQDLYRAQTGEVYVVGGDYDSSSSVSTGAIFREDGTPVSYSPFPLIDSWYDDAFVSIDGTGGLNERIYALARSNSNGRGEIHQLMSDGGFERVYTAPFRLAKLDVMPTGEVWAAGSAFDRVVYFDGGVWAEHLLPTTEFRGNVFWENVNATTEGLILTGFEIQEDGGRTALVNTYRRFGQ